MSYTLWNNDKQTMDMCVDSGACAIVAKLTKETPLEMIDHRIVGGRSVPIYVKRESHQYGGSFKMRGVGYTVYTAFTEIREMNADPSTPFSLVTQSTGNHGIAMLAALIKCLQYFPELDFVEPVVFASKNIQIEKLNKMNHLLNAYRILVGRPDAGNVLVDYENYKDALCARETFLSRNRGKYMSHGGNDIMTGHSSIGYEIHDQLLPKALILTKRFLFMRHSGLVVPLELDTRCEASDPLLI